MLFGVDTVPNSVVTVIVTDPMPPGLGQLLCALGRHLVGRCLGEERLTASRLGDKALLRLARIPCMQGDLDLAHTDRSEERRGGKECVSPCLYRGAPYH